MNFRTADAPAEALLPDDEAWSPDGPHWRTNRPLSPWQSLPPRQGPAGVTALAGQVLRLNGAPLQGVTLELNGHKAETDRTGRFLLLAPGGAGGYQVLVIEGQTANRPGRTYGRFEVRVRLNAGQTTALPFTIWMPRIDRAHAVPIPSPTRQTVVVTTPLIPGLELHLPPNTVIRDHQGQVVRELTITPIPLDRTPFPLPEHFEPPVYFTIQPGGAYVHTYGSGARGARLIYPTHDNTPGGIITAFWHYEPEEKGWYVYGTGLVSPDGTRAVPDPGVGFYEFTGAMMQDGNTPAGSGAAAANGDDHGDPVDLASGLFVLEKIDLYLPDVMPLVLDRTYRPGDTQSRPFGIGSTHRYAMFLWSAQQYQQADLILPDGGRIHYVRTSSGTGYVDAVFEHTATPSPFYKSVLDWNGDGWDLTLKDGTVYVFGDNAPIQRIRDRYGNTTTLAWSDTSLDGHGYGNILKVTSPSGRFIEFTYDGSDRITEATDNIGRTVEYEYDGSGRLTQVTDPAGGVTQYTYDSSHRMLTIEDAREIVFLTNEYDSNGRVVLQTLADDTTFEFDYTLDGSGKVTQADLTNQRGYVDRWTFNGNGYMTSHVEAVGTALARTTTFDLHTGSNRIERITDPLDRETAFTYDSNGNVTSITRLDGTADEVTTTFTYESTFSQLASVTDPLNHTTTFDYDSLGRLITLTDALDHETTFTYNAQGLPLTVTNPLSQTTTFTYDLNDLVGITDPLTRSTTRFIDAAGRLVSIRNALGQTTRYAYDVLNRVTSILDARGGETTFTYDANSNLLTLTDARDNTTTYTYDDMDRVATRTDPLDREESFTYDDNGNLATVTDRKDQVTAYTYDALDRLTLTTYEDSSTTEYAYDDGDRVTEIDDSAAGVITRDWDGLDRLIEEDTPEGLVSYSYDDAGRRATMTVCGQSALSYAYDNANRLTEVEQGTASVSMSYDNANRRTSLTLPNGIEVEYGYDAASQITGVTYSLGETTLGDLDYNYDLAGNRTVLGGSYARTGLPAAMEEATYDAANQIDEWDSTAFTYDANGNLTSDGVRTYNWNTRDQLVSLSGRSMARSRTTASGDAGRRRSAERQRNSSTMG
jgi:YD repeat-containing protein